jgi:hypothetical protein
VTRDDVTLEGRSRPFDVPLRMRCREVARSAVLAKAYVDQEDISAVVREVLDLNTRCKGTNTGGRSDIFTVH